MFLYVGNTLNDLETVADFDAKCNKWVKSSLHYEIFIHLKQTIIYAGNALKEHVYVYHMDTFWYIHKQVQFSHLVLQISKRVLAFSLALFITKSSRTTAVSMLKVLVRYFHSC